MTGENKLKEFAYKNYQKEIVKINNHVYHFFAFGHSNATAIIGDTSIILVDALDCDGYAKDIKTELQKITDKPVKTIIFTHGHPDHRGGAGAFSDTVTEIIAFSPKKPVLKYYEKLHDILNRRGTYQHGYGLTDEEALSDCKCKRNLLLIITI